MTFDELLERVRRRLATYQQTHQANTLLCDLAKAEAVELLQAALPVDPNQPTSEGKRQLLAAVHALGWLHFRRYTALPEGLNAGELARAIIFLEPLAHNFDAIPEPLHVVLGLSAEPDAQATLACGLLEQAMTTTDPDLLDAAARLLIACVEASPTSHPDRAARLSNLGLVYQVQFQRGESYSKLNSAIDLGGQAVKATPIDHPDRAMYLSNLGNGYQRRFEHGGLLADLEQAIEVAEQAVETTPHDHPNRAMYLSNLGGAYQRLFDYRGVLSDLGRTIEVIGQAVETTPHHHPNRAMYLSNLSGAYQRRFERGGAPADLDRAIDLSAQAVQATTASHPNRAAYLSILGSAHLRRFERGGVVDDSDRAIEVSAQAVELAISDGPNRAMYLTNLSLAYQRRFERSGNIADLDQAIETGLRSVTTVPTDHPDRANYLSNLGMTYRTRFERRGAFVDLDLAIELGGQAVETTPADHPNRSMYLSNLSLSYRTRFERAGSLTDLDRAIEVGAQAVEATPADHPNRAAYLSNLGIGYQSRFARGGTLADLDRAIAVGAEAVEVTPADHPDRAGSLSNLGIGYRLRFARGGSLADLDRAIAVGAEAVEVTPADHPDRAEYLSNLGLAHRARFHRDGVLTDLDMAIRVAEQALESTPADHPNWALVLSNLAGSWIARFDARGQSIHRETLHTLAREATATTTASPVHQVSVGHALGSLASAMDEHATAVKLLDAAITMLPLVATRDAEWADQEHRLGHHFGLVEEAIAAHCAVNDPVGAVQAAESGRGVLLATHLDSRTDLTELDDVEPALAARYRQVREHLNTPRPAPDRPGFDTPQHIEDRKRWWAEHDKLLIEIRQHQYPRFARFLRPPLLADLQRAVDGPVILVNAARHRSDAIIITSDSEPILVPLAEVSLAEVDAHAVALLEATHDASILAGTLRRQRVLSNLLNWLWTSVVQPVLEALPPTGNSGGPLPRVWWLPTGRLGLFPMHAAGPPSRPGALDRVVSSYTPTLRALAHVRLRPAAISRRQLIVTLTHTPGLPDLPGVVAEAIDLRAHHPNTPLLSDDDATTSRVLTALQEATWAHFACHASADLTAPSHGGLRLHDDILPIPDISRLHLTNAELAYLSACSTAHRGWNHADECIHLASAFQLAGFRHVIASLWPLNDMAAATAAHNFYRHLPNTPTADTAATALHRVVRDLRAHHPNRPDLWAPLIHSGP